MLICILLGQLLRSGGFVFENDTPQTGPVSAMEFQEQATGLVAQEILQNPGFETGSLSPWYQNGNHWVITDIYPHSGSYCATDTGNYWIRQDFVQPVPVESVISITLWSRQAPEKQVYLQAIDLIYSDLTYYEDVVRPDTFWQQWDVTGWLSPGKQLAGLRIWGFVSSDTLPDSTYIDDVSIIANLPLQIKEGPGLDVITLSAWPSTFSSSCRVDLHAPSTASLRLYSPSGAMLKQLWHGQGNATIQFGSDLRPGVYLLSLDCGRTRLSRLVIKR